MATEGQPKPGRGWVVGIDLGTTNTVVAFAAEGEPQLFEVPQLVSGGLVQAQALLPSALYAPLPEEGIDEALTTEVGKVPWVSGEHARRRGMEVSERMVSSAKSWLSYPEVDRRAPILPWRLAGDPNEGEGEDAAPRLSPVDAASLVLGQIQARFDEAYPHRKLADQEVVITVPASFDAVARQLTVEAARARGIEARLLEEPQAAFYDLWRRGGDELLRAVCGEAGRGLVLVVDVGGGTTDLSLIAVRQEADLEVERVAVGRHLLLGGDNMDLALAHLCEQRLQQEGKLEARLSERHFAELVLACRAAKEHLLAEDGPPEAPVAIGRGGSRLVGGTLRTALSREEVRAVVVDGFFPRVELGAAPPTLRGGIVAFGLPYEREVAITRHVALFLSAHVGAGTPTALMLNGGVFRAPALATRMVEVVRGWFSPPPVHLTLTDPDTSVALGAVAYGLARKGRGRRITSGAPKSYYLGVGAGAVCVLPMGTEEGQPQRVEGDYTLTLGRKVRFDLYAAERRDAAGALVVVDADVERLAPLVTELRGEGETIAVALEAELSAVGTLDIACVALAAAERRYALAFDLRDQGHKGHEGASAQKRYGKRLEQAQALIERLYGKRSRKEAEPKEVKGLVRALEKLFGKRSQWEASLIRSLFDVLIRHHKGRKVSPDHERVFWMLAGFCLRPGTGHARDEERLAALFGELDQRLAHPAERRSWQQFWICWRRVAAGLDEAAQTRLRDLVDPFLAPSEAGLKLPKAWRNEERWEMLELASSLERVPATRRGELGGWIVERTWLERDHRLWAALGRVGARIPTYGSAHQVVAARTVERWMDHLLREKWQEIPSAPNAAIAMCRLTGDRARDLSDTTRAKVDQKLAQIGVDEARRRPVSELVALDERDRAAFYGEDLPPGLTVSS